MKFTMYHTCITVFDLKKSMDFYEEALGLHEVRRIEAEDGSSIIVFLGSEGGFMLSSSLHGTRTGRNIMTLETTKFISDSVPTIIMRLSQSTGRWDVCALRTKSSVYTLLRIRTDIGARSFR